MRSENGRGPRRRIPQSVRTAPCVRTRSCTEPSVKPRLARTCVRPSSSRAYSDRALRKTPPRPPKRRDLLRCRRDPARRTDLIHVNLGLTEGRSPLLSQNRHELTFAELSLEAPDRAFQESFSLAGWNLQSDGRSLRDEPIWPLSILV